MTSFVVSSAIVSSGNTLGRGESGVVLSGGMSLATSTGADAMLKVMAGGTACATTIAAGGTVRDAGLLIGAIVSSGGDAQVLRGGLVTQALLKGGTLQVMGGGTARRTHLRQGATLEVASGGVASGAQATSSTIVDAGLLVSASTSAGLIEVLSGGVASAISANDFCTVTTLFVQSGGVLSGFALDGGIGDTLEVAGIATQGTIADDWALVQVSSGGAIGGLTFERPFGMNVFAGGVVSGMTVEAAGWAGVTGTLDATVVASGGDLEVMQDTSSVVSGLTVLSGGIADVFFTTAAGLPTSLPQAISAEAGAKLLAAGVTVGAGRTMRIAQLSHPFSAAAWNGLAGATEADRAQVRSGGAVVVGWGGIAVNTDVGSGGHMTLLSGGTSLYEDVQRGAVVRVLSGAQDIWGAAFAGGTVLDAGGIVSALALVGAGASAAVGSGGVVVGGLVAEGSLTIASGGEAVATMLDPSPYFANDFTPAVMRVASGGLALTTTVGEGTIVVAAGGTATDTIVGVFNTSLGTHHAAMTVFGSASGVTVIAGTQYADASALLCVAAGGVVSGLAVGMHGTAADAGMVGTLSVTSGGTARVLSCGLLHGATISGGELWLDAGAVAQGSIGFVGPGGDLLLAGTVGPPATVSGFAPGDTVDLRSLSFTSAISASFLSGNVLAVGSGATTIDVRFDPRQNFGADIFKLGSDGAGGTDLTLATSAEAPASGWAGALLCSGGHVWTPAHTS